MFGKITIPKTINFTPPTSNSGPSINIGVPGCDEPLGPPAVLADVTNLTNEIVLTKPIADLGGDCCCDCSNETLTPAAVQKACGVGRNEANCNLLTGICSFVITIRLWDGTFKTTTYNGHIIGDTCYGPAASVVGGGNKNNYYGY